MTNMDQAEKHLLIVHLTTKKNFYQSKDKETFFVADDETLLTSEQLRVVADYLDTLNKILEPKDVPRPDTTTSPERE